MIMKKIYFLLIALLYSAMMAFAYDAQIDGIYYNFDYKNNTAIVTSGDNKYFGDVIIPEKVSYNHAEYNVTSIGDFAFSQCKSLASVTLPSTLNTIGYYAFRSSSLITMTIPEGVTIIKEYAFGECSSLKQVILPNTLNTIESKAFRYCTALTSITIPSSVTSIGDNAFEYCGSINAVYISDIVAWCNIDFGWASNPLSGNPDEKTTDLYLNNQKVTDLVIPESVTEIKNFTFFNCNLNSIVIPNSVTSIGSNAFKHCSLRTITIPSSVKTIGQEAFRRMNNLSKVIMESNVPPQLGGAAFAETDKVLIFIPEGTRSAYQEAWGDDLIFVEKEVEVSLNIETPGTLNNEILNAGYNLEDITKLTLTGTLNDDDFRLMKESMPILLDVNLSGITNTNSFNFEKNCTIQNIILPDNLETIDDGDFNNCKSLYSVIMSNSITNIDIWAFYECSSLTEITFSENLERIEGRAFSGCSALTNITLPNSVTFIGDWTFADCTSLKSIKLSDNLTTIDPNAFNGCSVLTKIEIPHKVELIRENAFGNCPKLNTIVCYGETPQVEIDLGLDVSTCLLKVPSIFYDDYKNHEYWGNFVNIEAIDVTYYKIEALANDSEMGEVIGGKYYWPGDTVRLEAVAYNGYEFKQWNDGSTENPRVFVAKKDVVLTAEFIERLHEVTISYNEIEGNVIGGGKYKAGTEVKITATANEGYRFVYWKFNGEYYWDYETVYENPYTFKVDSKDYHIEAVFEQIPLYKVDLLSNFASGGTLSGGGEYTPGTEVTIRATVNEGYHFLYWLFDDNHREELGGGYGGTMDTVYTFIMGENNYEFTAVFEPDKVLIDSLYYYLFKDENCIKVSFYCPEDWERVNLWAWLDDGTNVLGVEWPGYTINNEGNGWWSYTFDASIEDVNILFTDGYGKQTRDILDVRESTCYMLDEFGEIVISNDCNKISYYAILTTPADWNGWRSSYVGDIVIPEKVTHNSIEYPVTSIDYYSFANSEITSLTIPNSIPSNNVFDISWCYNLNKVKAHKNWIYALESQLANLNIKELHITGGYIDYIPRIPSIEVLNLQKVANGDLPQTAFAEFLGNNGYIGFRNLRQLILPEELWIIKERQFEGLWLLEEIVIPNGVTEIPEAAFYDCHALSKVTLSKNLTSIGNYAFYSCHALENIVIPEGVTEIGNAAFYGCTYLENIELPFTLEEIGNNAFALCSKVRKIKTKAHTPPALWAKTFYEVDRNTPVYVADVAYTDYVADQYWGEFFNIIATPEYNEDPTGVENTDETSVVIYTQGGMLYVEGVETDYNVFDTSGRLIYTGRDAQLSLPRGVYMIHLGDEIKKIVL